MLKKRKSLICCIAEEMTLKGTRLVSRSDVELLLAAYEAYGGSSSRADIIVKSCIKVLNNSKDFEQVGDQFVCQSPSAVIAKEATDLVETEARRAELSAKHLETRRRNEKYELSIDMFAKLMKVPITQVKQQLPDLGVPFRTVRGKIFIDAKEAERYFDERVAPKLDAK